MKEGGVSYHEPLSDMTSQERQAGAVWEIVRGTWWLSLLSFGSLWISSRCCYHILEQQVFLLNVRCFRFPSFPGPGWGPNPSLQLGVGAAAGPRAAPRSFAGVSRCSLSRAKSMPSFPPWSRKGSSRFRSTEGEPLAFVLCWNLGIPHPLQLYLEDCRLLVKIENFQNLKRFRTLKV